MNGVPVATTVTGCFSSQVPFPIALVKCRQHHLYLVAEVRQPSADTARIHLVVYSERSLGGLWHVELTERGAGGRQHVAFDQSVPANATWLQSWVVLEGISDPRLRVSAARKDGPRCGLAFNPPDLADLESR